MGDFAHSTSRVGYRAGVNSPLTLMSDQDRISPYNIKIISSTLVMRMNKNINLGVVKVKSEITTDNQNKGKDCN